MANFSEMETLILTAELGSLAAVGRTLGLSSAAVSKQLTRMEKKLGVQLLIRTTRHIELTEIGLNYCTQCKRILEEMEAASALVSNFKATPSGSLKVVSGRHFGASYIVPHIKEFLASYPKIELNVELAERIPNLIEEGIDILIGMSISAGGNAIQRCLALTSYVFCASPGYLKEFGTPKKPKELKLHRYIAHSMRKPDNEILFKNGETAAVIPYIRLNDTQTMLKLALEGLGIVMLHHYVVKKYLEEGSLKQVLAAYNNENIPIYAAYPERRYISSKVRCFIDFISSKL